jgi:hypothetical protein
MFFVMYKILKQLNKPVPKVNEKFENSPEGMGLAKVEI